MNEINSGGIYKMEMYSIGTVVNLKAGEQELMITSRFPLYNNKGEIGYFEYGGCLYPQGETSENNFFFNSEDIEAVLFEGYTSEEELQLRESFKNQISEIKYPKLSVNDTY